MEIISQKEAKKQGLNRYFTGKKCKSGHDSERYVSGGVCVDCRKKENKGKGLGKFFTGVKCRNGHISERYLRDGKCCKCVTEGVQNYALKNPEKRKEQIIKYNEENRDSILAYFREYNKKNKGKRKEQSRLRYEGYKEQICEKQRQYRLDNIEQIRLKDNVRGKIRSKEKQALNAKRKSQKIKALPLWADLEIIKDIFKKRPSGFHVDHILPLQSEFVCGLHTELNLQYLEASKNLEKGNKFTPYSQIGDQITYIK